MPTLIPASCPDAVFKTRVRKEALSGPNPFEWKDLSTSDVFAGKNIVFFALPGAFTPACSDEHLPGYEDRFDEFRALGVDQINCLSVNDAFVMFQWARARRISNIFMLPDGNGDFAGGMGMLVDRSASGMGKRSWRYSMHVIDGKIQRVFEELGKRDNPDGVPLQISDACTMLDYLKNQSK